jgi:hypothetical protein
VCEATPAHNPFSLPGIITRRIVALGVFLLIVVRIHRHIAVCSSFTHTVVMSLVKSTSEA